MLNLISLIAVVLVVLWVARLATAWLMRTTQSLREFAADAMALRDRWDSRAPA